MGKALMSSRSRGQITPQGLKADHGHRTAPGEDYARRAPGPPSSITHMLPRFAATRP